MISGAPESGTVVLRTGRDWLRFARPVKLIVEAQAAKIRTALAAIETATQEEGLFAAGYIAYEAATGLGLATNYKYERRKPLLWFGLYEDFEPVELARTEGSDNHHLSWRAAVERQAYIHAIQRVKHQIAEGYTYQVNYTFPMLAAFEGDAWALFTAMVRAQQAPYAAYVDTGFFIVCSASPELFFRLEGERLTSKPMKGTAPRGRTLTEDRRLAAGLLDSEKNRAENVMIVDMIRNDMGRVARTGSVNVPELFTVETYPTLHQMTSTVTSETSASLVEIMSSLFPCASITGAPKHSTMQIIRQLEPEPRGIYTGAVGMIGPARQALFNVAIRTVEVDKKRRSATYGVGSGIVWDSEAEAEYEECLLKARVLGGDRATRATWAHRAFELLESILWEPDQGYFLLEEHVRRIADSAAFFGIPFVAGDLRQRLETLAESLRERSKVRALVDREGAMRFETQALRGAKSGAVVGLGLATEPVDSNTIWLYHKTTERSLYQAASRSRPDCEDVLLWNERGEVTESTTANVVVELGGILCTPPISSGLLAGTLRASLLREGRIQEQVVGVDALQYGGRIYLINSVRKWREAQLMADRPDAA